MTSRPPGNSEEEPRSAAEPAADDDSRARTSGMPAIGELDYIGAAVKQSLILAIAILIVFLIAPQLFDRLLEVVSSSDRLRTIRPWWFVLMVLAEVMSFASLWWLIRLLLPKASWFVAATSQLTANSVSRVVPGGGGAAAGGATLYRMLAVSGTHPTQAGGALAAMSVLSTAALAAIPAIGVTIALFGAPIPEGLSPIAIASGVLCVLLLTVGVVALRTTTPLLLAGRVLDRILRLAARPLKKNWQVSGEMLVTERDRLASLLGDRWPQATAASALNWTFDYLVLVFALYAVDAEPRLSLVMIAYAGGAVLSMISITPGGTGFVEVGLIHLLVLSGIPADRAAVAVLAYRGISLWLPIAGGFFAWLAFRRKYPRRTADIEPDQVAESG